MEVTVRPLRESDRGWANAVLVASWGGTPIESRGRSHDAARLPGLLAELGGEPVGLATYVINAGGRELITLDSVRPGMGVGTALVDAVCQRAAQASCSRVWLTTTCPRFASTSAEGSTWWQSIETE